MKDVKVDCFREDKYLGTFYVREGLTNDEIIDLYYKNFRQ